MKKNLKTGFYRIYVVLSVLWLITFSFLSVKFSNSEGYEKWMLNHLTFSIFYIGLFPVIFNGYKDIKKIFRGFIVYISLWIFCSGVYFHLNTENIYGGNFVGMKKEFVYLIYLTPVFSYFIIKIFNYIYDGFSNKS
jgi:hypothetical protein